MIAKTEYERNRISNYLKTFDWYDEFKELVYKYHPKDYAERIMAGYRYEHTILYAFPFSKFPPGEKEKWIARHNDFYGHLIGRIRGIVPTDDKIEKILRNMQRKERRKAKKENETLGK